jgi:hypothetical protein
MSHTVRRYTQVAGVLCALLLLAAFATAGARASSFPRYNHVFLIQEENEDYSSVIGNPADPIINALASHYGLATNYTGVADPSEPNYVAILGGSSYGLASDDPSYFPGNSVNEPNVMSELEAAGYTWKAYLQGSPYNGYRGYCFPSKCNGIPDADTQYVEKHNGIPFFANMQTPSEWAKEQPYSQLQTDLGRGDVPNFAFIEPDECHDMHGAPPWCVDSDNPFTVDDNWLQSNADKFVGETVNAITSAKFWMNPDQNNAIVLTWDEGDEAGSQVVTIVITNHGPRGLQDATSYNHYSLNASLTAAFGLACLGASSPQPPFGDGCTQSPMTPLFTPSGSTTVPRLPKPVDQPPNTTPMPSTSPVTGPAVTFQKNGWQLISSPNLTTDDDNVLSSVSAASATDAWAVGNYYPDVSSTQATTTGPILQTFGEHWNGSRWTAYPLPDVGDNENSLLNVSELPRGGTWAVGYYIDENYNQQALVEHYNGSSWSVIPAQNPGAEGNILYGVAAISDSNVWAVGGERDAHGIWHPLVEHYNGNAWSVVSFPTSANPGSELLYGISADAANDIYAIGQDGTSFPEQLVIGHYDGSSWTLEPSPTDAIESLDPLGIDAHPGALTIVGQRESDTVPNTTLVASGAPSNVALQTTPNVGAGENDLFSATKAADGSEWAGGWYIDPTNGENHEPLVEHLVNGTWQTDQSVDTNSFAKDGGDNGFASIAAIPGGGLWAVGLQTIASTGATQTLIEHRN